MEPTVYVNPARATPSVVGPDDHDDDHDRKVEANVLGFHRKLPHYEETPLHSFPGLAEELELGHVFVKDESKRLGLPSFKILGASWAVFRAVGEELGLNLDSLENDAVAEVGLAEGAVEGRFVSTPGWQKLASDAREQELSLVTCTEGNWGRAVASMAKYLSIPVKIFVPSFMPETTLARIRSEGTKAVVERVEGNYDDSVAAARREATTREGAILVMDMGWDGYEKIPGWVVEGYSTMLREADVQVHEAAHGKTATHAIVPVGVGSIAQAVTRHYKKPAQGARPSRACVVAVEPTSAAGLKASLEAGKILAVETGDSIMCGMNCGTVSATAWPTLRSGIDADVTVADLEAHAAVSELETLGLQPGPCGAATLAALRRACRDAREELRLGRDSVVILFCTEGRREYEVPSSGKE